jgi:membrane associated rhomboid family serine protease
MRILDRIERKIGWFSIPNLILYVIIGNAAVWLTGFAFRDISLLSRLYLAPQMVFRGEIWRIFSFVLLNSFGSSPISVIFELYFLYMVGSSLEYNWGSFRLTFYYFASLLLTAAVSLLTNTPVAGAMYIHLSLFLAFAQIAPEMRILLFFFIPVKIKYMGWAAWAFIAFQFVMSPGWGDRLIILAALAVFVLFFGSQITHSLRLNRRAFINKREYGKKINSSKLVRASFHKCGECGKTEIDAPDTEFRYCSKCQGNYEYCMDHLNNHIHHSS